MLTLEQRLSAFVQLGRVFAHFGKGDAWPGYACGLSQDEFDAFGPSITRAEQANGWFTRENTRHMLRSLGLMLDEQALRPWCAEYGLTDTPAAVRTIGMVMAGNVPLVGFHDLLCVLLSGRRARIKLSSQDAVLMPAVIDVLDRFAPGMKQLVAIADGKLGDVDAVIATGSNNTARYFEHYFGNLPRVVRKGRMSVAVLDGHETDEDLRFLAEDVFRYFGLGCRSVSKLYIPRDFNLDRFFGAAYDWKGIIDHHKYANNYDYNRAVWLLEQVPFLENGFVQLKEDAALASPVAALYYERYDDRAAVLASLHEQRDRIQIIVGKGPGLCPFGNSQFPHPWDYADDVDTMAFLKGLA